MDKRQYQIDAVNAVIQSWTRYKRVFLTAPTGSGKTHITYTLLQQVMRPGQVALLVANRKIIVRQLENKFTDMPSCVARTIQSLNQQYAIDELIAKHGRVDYLIYDEASTAMNDSGWHIYNSLNHPLENPANETMRVLGIDATTERSDNMPLSFFYEHCAYQIKIEDTIQQGYTAKPNEKFIQCHSPSSQQIVNTWLLHGRSRRTIVFVKTIANVEKLAMAFRNAGVNAAAHHSKLTKQQREQALTADVIVNDATLTRGADIPGISCVLVVGDGINATYIQQVGRGLRPDTKDCLIVHMGNRKQSYTQENPPLESNKAHKRREKGLWYTDIKTNLFDT